MPSLGGGGGDSHDDRSGHDRAPDDGSGDDRSGHDHDSTFASALDATVEAPISWYWQLQGAVNLAVPVEVYEIDGFDTNPSTVAALHAQGKTVICYIDLGTAESNRSDFSSFPASVMGSANGFPGETWLDIRQLSVLEPIMTARMQMCVQKGFDALEADNVDGFKNATGFPLTAEDQLTYNTWIATTAHSLGLSVGLKNDNSQTAQLQPYFDWALDEQCNEFSQCGTEQVFTKRATRPCSTPSTRAGRPFVLPTRPRRTSTARCSTSTSPARPTSRASGLVIGHPLRRSPVRPAVCG